MAQAIEEWYKQMPVITRSYLTAAVAITIGCSLEVCLFFFFFIMWFYFLFLDFLFQSGQWDCDCALSIFNDLDMLFQVFMRMGIIILDWFDLVYLNVVNLVIPVGFDPWVSIHVSKLEIWAGKVGDIWLIFPSWFWEEYRTCMHCCANLILFSFADNITLSFVLEP